MKTSENSLLISLQNGDIIIDYFVNNLNKSDNCIEKIYSYSSNKFSNSIFLYKLADESDILLAIESVKSNSARNDRIPLRILSLPVIKSHIIHIINCSLDRGFFS